MRRVMLVSLVFLFCPIRSVNYDRVVVSTYEFEATD